MLMKLLFFTFRYSFAIFLTNKICSVDHELNQMNIAWQRIENFKKRPTFTIDLSFYAEGFRLSPNNFKNN